MKTYFSQAWNCMPVILVLGWLRQKDLEFQVSLDYTVRLCFKKRREKRRGEEREGGREGERREGKKEGRKEGRKEVSLRIPDQSLRTTILLMQSSGLRIYFDFIF
jgi:hypothetical protein